MIFLLKIAVFVI